MEIVEEENSKLKVKYYIIIIRLMALILATVKNEMIFL